VKKKNAPTKRPRVLLFDIETAPIIGYVWALFDQNVSIEQIVKDWHILAWSAKWLGTDQIMYADNRNSKNIEDDKKILKDMWELLNDADIVITQNGKRFDVKKLNARFVIHGFKPPSGYKHIDTLELAKRYFGFTSNKLEYLSNKLNKKFKKLTKRKFNGFSLWKECLAGNPQAWREMEKYNKQDVLALEEVYKTLIPWDSTINFNLYNDETVNECSACGHHELVKNGFAYTARGKFQRYSCKNCGNFTRSTKNLFSKEKRESLRVGAK
jgi:Aeromonas phage DNA polymerase exonuclease subunit